MHIVILGAGAIGRLFGVYLGRAGHRITLVEPNSAIVEAINGRGLGYMEQGGHDPDAVDFVSVRAVLHAQDIMDADLTLLAVKSHDTLAAVQPAVHLISNDSPLLTLQTGLGNIEVIEQVISRKQVIGGFTFMAATGLGPGVVRQGGVGKTYIGEPFAGMSGRVQEIAGIFSESGLVCTPVHRILGRLWCKVIVFSAINSLSAVLQIKNGSLLDSMESITLMKRLIDEGRAVAGAQAIDLVFNDLYGLLFDACKRTEYNISSMLQDILSGQRTEIEAQCAALVRYGERTGVATPTQRTMVELVRLVEKKAIAEGLEGGLR